MLEMITNFIYNHPFEILATMVITSGALITMAVTYFSESMHYHR